MQPLAQIGVGRAQHARARIVLHAVDRRFRREAGSDRLVQTPEPALVVGDHAQRLENFDVLALACLAAAIDKLVDIGAQRIERFIEFASSPPAGSSATKFLMMTRGSCSTAWPRPMPSARILAMQGQRTAHCNGFAGLDDRLQFAGRDDLRQHHRGRLERLDLFFRVSALRLVLDDEHAERIAGAQDRHAEERMVNFLARLRPVGKGRMMLRVGNRQRLGFACDEADSPSPALRRVR